MKCIEARDAAKYPTMHRVTPLKRIIIEMSIMPRMRNPELEDSWPPGVGELGETLSLTLQDTVYQRSFLLRIPCGKEVRRAREGNRNDTQKPKGCEQTFGLRLQSQICSASEMLEEREVEQVWSRVRSWVLLPLCPFQCPRQRGMWRTWCLLEVQ